MTATRARVPRAPRPLVKVALDARMVEHSGIGRFLQFLIPWLQRQPGVELLLLGDPEKLKAYPAKVIRLRTPIYSPFEQWELWRKVPACDIFWSPHYNAPVWEVPARLRVVNVHDVFHLSEHSDLSGPKRAYAAWLMQNAARRADLVIAGSQTTAHELAKHLRLNAIDLKKVRVNYYAIDPQFRPARASSGRTLPIKGPFLLYVGNVKPHKNIEGLLRAFAQIKPEHPRLKLVLVGNRVGFITGLPVLEKLLHELGLGSEVVFTGRISDPTLVELYQHAEALVFPSFYEGFGYPPLEAMACHCPVLISAIPALLETSGKAALSVDPRSVTSLAKGLRRIVKDRKLRQRLVRAGAEQIKAYAPGRIERAYRHVLDELLARLDRPRTPSPAARAKDPKGLSQA